MSDALLVQDLLERCATLGTRDEPVTARKMFGGHGLYAGRAMFAIVIDGVAFFKTDEENRADFESAGGQPFTYEHNGRTTVMSFWTLPESAWANPHRFLPWAASALHAARRTLAKRPPDRRRKSKRP